MKIQNLTKRIERKQSVLPSDPQFCMNLTKRIESARDNRRTAWSVARISQRELKVLESLVEKGLLFRNLTKRIESFTLITPFSVFTSPSNLTKRIERQML